MVTMLEKGSSETVRETFDVVPLDTKTWRTGLGKHH
jgi:hypothetical protein